MKWFGLELTEICFFYSYQKWHSKKCLNDALCHNCNIFTCTQSISMKLILLESYEADLSNSGYNIQFGEELTEIQTNLYSVCKHSDTFLAHCTCMSTGIYTTSMRYKGKHTVWVLQPPFLFALCLFLFTHSASRSCTATSFLLDSHYF